MRTSGDRVRGRVDLLLNLIRAELTARYKSTTLGMLWFVLNPILTMLILVVVFQRLIRLDIENYPVFVLTALLPWTFFQMGFVNASGSIMRSSGLVKRVSVPRVFIPLSAILASLIHFLVSLVVLFGCMLALHVPFTRYLLLLPVVILIQLVFLVGAGLLGAALSVLYRDVEHAIEPGLRIMFYLTPSFYPLSFVPERWLGVYLLNPMAGIVAMYRQLILEGALPSAFVLGMALATSLVVVMLGTVAFRRAEPYFDDYI